MDVAAKRKLTVDAPTQQYSFKLKRERERMTASRKLTRTRLPFPVERKVLRNCHRCGRKVTLLYKNINISLKEFAISSDDASTRRSRGIRSGTTDDKDILCDIITSELRKPENLAISNDVHKMHVKTPVTEKFH